MHKIRSSNEDAEAVLSDVESDEPSPLALNDPPREDGDGANREKKAREAAESSKSDLQASFNRLKALAHEVIKKREESKRERDEAFKEKERLSKELESVSKSKDEMKFKLDEVVRDRDALKGEIESSSRMLVSGIEKFLRSSYGVIKRANEIVEELVREIDKSRNEASKLHVLKEELEEAKQAIKESEKKLKFKEETAAAAMGARDAAE
ncbi:hypothetical protein HID58_030496 [Brassica napus]|uniref:RAB6-interacting golgin n=1 Tax=Brassica napus TaxID=3708 RepID=A0ABQ8CG53_BRANA|nr:hypothetical protein HID58_030496 [Brassica napus]